MKQLILELRMLMAVYLLYPLLWITPKKHEEGKALHIVIKLWIDWLNIEKKKRKLGEGDQFSGR